MSQNLRYISHSVPTKATFPIRARLFIFPHFEDRFASETLDDGQLISTPSISVKEQILLLIAYQSLLASANTLSSKDVATNLTSQKIFLQPTKLQCSFFPTQHHDHMDFQ